MIEVFNEFGNPFTETSDNVFALDTKVIMSENVIDNITTTEAMGREQTQTQTQIHLFDQIKMKTFTYFD